MKWLLILLLIVFVMLGGFLLSPSPIDSRAWQAVRDSPADKSRIRTAHSCRVTYLLAIILSRFLTNIHSMNTHSTNTQLM